MYPEQGNDPPNSRRLCEECQLDLKEEAALEKSRSKTLAIRSRNENAARRITQWVRYFFHRSSFLSQKHASVKIQRTARRFLCVSAFAKWKSTFQRQQVLLSIRSFSLAVPSKSVVQCRVILIALDGRTEDGTRKKFRFSSSTQTIEQGQSRMQWQEDIIIPRCSRNARLIVSIVTICGWDIDGCLGQAFTSIDAILGDKPSTGEARVALGPMQLDPRDKTKVSVKRRNFADLYQRANESFVVLGVLRPDSLTSPCGDFRAPNLEMMDPSKTILEARRLSTVTLESWFGCIVRGKLYVFRLGDTAPTLILDISSGDINAKMLRDLGSEQVFVETLNASENSLEYSALRRCLVVLSREDCFRWQFAISYWKNSRLGLLPSSVSNRGTGHGVTVTHSEFGIIVRHLRMMRKQTGAQALLGFEHAGSTTAPRDSWDLQHTATETTPRAIQAVAFLLPFFQQFSF